jgi:torulene dioxygenase
MTKFIDSFVKRCCLQYDILPPSITTGPVNPPWSAMEGWIATILSVPLFDNTPVNVEKISSTNIFAAVTDAPVSMSFNIETLQTIGKVEYKGRIRGLEGFPLFSTAHSKVGSDGRTYNYFLEIAPQGFFANLVRTNNDLTQTCIGRVSTDGKLCYIHDISLTENYALIVVYPIHVNPLSLSSGLGFLSQLQFESSCTTKIHVFSLASGQYPRDPVATFETQPFFAYHHVNAYEDHVSNSIVLDILGYDNGDIANSPHGFLYMENMKNRNDRIKQVREANVWRFSLDLNANGHYVVPKKSKFSVSGENEGESYGFELATVSPLVKGNNYRYCYGFTGHYKGSQDFLDWAIVKQDVQTGEGNAVWYEEYAYPGEPIFVPDPKSLREDGGVLLSSVYDSKKGENYLLVLDATTMREVARAYTGSAM